MSEPILDKPFRLTEDNIQVLEDNSYYHDKDGNHLDNAPNIIVEGRPIEKAENVKRLLLTNQQIIDIVKKWAQSEPILISNGRKLTEQELKIRRGSVHHLVNLIKSKTGMDIKVVK